MDYREILLGLFLIAIGSIRRKQKLPEKKEQGFKSREIAFFD